MCTTGSRKLTLKLGHTDESGYRSPALKQVEIQREEIREREELVFLKIQSPVSFRNQI